MDYTLGGIDKKLKYVHDFVKAFSWHSKTLFSYKKSEIKEISLKVEKPSIEEMLLEYVKKSNGEIDLGRCSNDLKTSNEEIEKALETLGTQGKIKIELKSPE